ncbi:DUF3349 domain-containing protein [Mycobacterium sp. BMJ-28]
MALSDVLARILLFLRAGYPEGVPAADYIPLIAVLRRRLSDDEVLTLTNNFIADGSKPAQGTDVRVAITKLTDEMPSHEDVQRVERRLLAAGWPIDDPLTFPK